MQRFDINLFLIIFLIGVLFSAIGAVANYLRDRKRLSVMTAFAEEIGLTFTPAASAGFLARMKIFKLFTVGRSKKIKNVVFGETDDETVSIFDYQYAVGSGKNQTIHRQSVVSIESPNLNAPSFVLRPASFFLSFGRIFGQPEIEFDSNPDFGKYQQLQGSDEKAIKEFFDDRFLRTLESNKYCIEAIGHNLIVYIPRKSFNSDELKAVMASAFEIYSAMVERGASLAR